MSHTKYDSSNIRSLLVDHDYVMMLMIDTQLIVKRDNCEQEVLLHGVRSIAHSKFFIFAILTNGDLHGWHGDLFRKGYYSGSNKMGLYKMDLKNVQMIRCCEIQMCAITNEFELYTSQYPFKKLEKHSLLHIVDVDCGAKHICALSKEGNVYVWGFNSHGQLGLGDWRYRGTPEKVDLKDKDIVSVGCGDYYSMALTKSGRIHMWGCDAIYSCCVSSYIHHLYNVISISCGDKYAMAVTTKNKVYVSDVPDIATSRMHSIANFKRIPYKF